MKKLLSVLLAALMVFALVGCSGSKEEGGEPTTSAEDVAVFWYTYSDVYLSSVRAAMNEAMDKAGLNYKDYDANGSQADQTNQIDTALAAGAKVLVVNQVDSGSDDVTKTILDKAAAAGAKVVFFNRGVSEDVLTAAGSTFVGTDYEQAGHMEGKMIGEYLVANYEATDLNGDGVIQYVMFKGDEANPEAICRTQFGQEDADAVLTANGKPALAYFDSAATTKYLLDANGTWSAAAANEHMETVLSQYNADNGNMIELVIANNDDMALGAIESLKNHGYNKEGETVIPVFGVDATDAAKA
ncbi:MAG: substrate-binding domain-containing protein, partial [Erysipelotrichaceae bacterium]|nr:substrate-binding domain-containing protein [Erysipelotrichaceae bacterium]